MSQSDASSQPAAETWTRVIDIARLNPPPNGTFVAVAGRELAVFQLDQPLGTVVIDNACPHANGNLSGGTLVGGLIECPWHQWQFDPATGRCVHAETVCVRKYPVLVRDAALYAKLADSPPGT